MYNINTFTFFCNIECKIRLQPCYFPHSQNRSIKLEECKNIFHRKLKFLVNKNCCFNFWGLHVKKIKKEQRKLSGMKTDFTKYTEERA